MPNNTHPLRLSIGSHEAGSGRGCAMNVISWENGDTKISDYPDCADPFLAALVQGVNDEHCERLDDGYLCPTCSVEVLDLAHKTVGTKLDDNEAAIRLYLELIYDLTEQTAKAYPARPLSECVRELKNYIDGEPLNHEKINELWKRAVSDPILLEKMSTDETDIAGMILPALEDADKGNAEQIARSIPPIWRIQLERENMRVYRLPDGRKLTLPIRDEIFDQAHCMVDYFMKVSGTKTARTEPATKRKAIKQMMKKDEANSYV